MEPTARLARTAIWLNALGGLLGLFGLLGHVLNVEWLLTLIPGRPPMKLGSALAVMLAALGMALQRGKRVGRVRRIGSMAIGAALVVFGSLICVQYVFGVNLNINVQLPNTPPRGPYTGRPSPFTALSLMQLGAALTLIGANRRWACVAREALCLSTTLVAFIALTGHVFGATLLFGFRGSQVVGIAFSTSIALCALGVAAWLVCPQALLLRLATAPGPGGVILRRLGLTAVLGGPALMGMLLILVNTIGLVDMRFTLAVGGVLGGVLALSLLVATAARLERTAEAAEAIRVSATRLFDEAPEGIFVTDATGHFIDVNAAGHRLLQSSHEEILANSIVDLIPEYDWDRLYQVLERMRQGSVSVDEWKIRRKDGAYVPVEVTAKVLPDGRFQGFIRDISQRRELERKLVESRDFLQGVLESSTEYAIVAEDLDHRVVLWNEGARRTLGYELEEIYGKPSDLLVAPERLSDWDALHAKGLRNGTAEGNITARRKDGRTFAANVVCTRRLGSDNCAAGVLTVSRDLTTEQRYLAEQEFLSRVGVELAACLEYRETLECVAQLAIGFLGDIIMIDVVKDNSLRREWVLVRGADQELARRFLELGAPPSASHPLQTVRETKQPLLVARTHSKAHKRLASSEAHARALEDANITSVILVPVIARGQLLAVLSISARDGSRTYGRADLRMAMELARRAALTLDNVQLFQQSRLQGAVTTNLGEGAALLRAADHAIVYANPRFARMFGFPLHELLGVRIATLSSALEAAHARMAKQLEQGASWHDEIECTRNDGTRFWCSVSVSNFDHEEHGRVWIALFTDITVRKSLERQTARALQEKDVLLKEIHHRVKNNLQVISSLFSLQRERTQNLEVKSLLSESQTRVESIALVHEQLYRSTDLAAIDFDEYLRSLLTALLSSYGAERIQTEISARDVLLDVEQAVPCALLVCELVSNSLKHAFDAAPGKVWVRVRRKPEDSIVIEVGDNGRGMPPDFDWRKTRALGLRLVQGLARQLRATIVVERSPGTRFILTFAVRTSKSAAPPASLTAAGTGR